MTLSILSLCDRSGNMVRPWAQAGAECICVDLQNDDRQEGNIRFVKADILEWIPELKKYAMVFAFPPCTDMAASGARWFSTKGLGAIARALELVNRCRLICEAAGGPYMIENPVSTLSTYWRQPDHSFDPCEYAGYLDEPEQEAYTKKTCLWTGGGFIMPEPRPVFPVLGSLMHRTPPSPERQNIRAITPNGFAKAVYLANCGVVE